MISILILYCYALASLASPGGCNPTPEIHGPAATQSENSSGQHRLHESSPVKSTSVVWGT